jgi:diacylglycerol kinase family enzyme
MRAVLLLNPVAGRSPLAESHQHSRSIEDTVLHALRLYGIKPEVWYSRLEDLGERLVQRVADEHLDLVIAAGGNGTIYAVASGIAGERDHAGYHSIEYDEQPCTQPGYPCINRGGLRSSC